MSLVTLAQKQIVNAFNGPLKDFLKEVTFEYLLDGGEYDPDTDSIAASYDSVGPLKVPVVRPSEEDMTMLGVETKDSKIIVPGNYLPKAMELSDRVLMDGRVHNIRRISGVPGDVVFMIFVRMT
jgi:hypothetical protein